MSRKKLALVDGHAVAFRAFHALRDAHLRASTGEPTFAVFGFCQILLTTLQQLQPQYAAVAFDVGRTFRDELYAEYKAGRGEAPDDFHSQLARIKTIVNALNIPVYTKEGYEADDVIGTLSRQATALDVDTYIITGDSDTLQLVDEHVRVLLAVPYGKRQEAKEYDLAAVIERYKGLRPAQLADLRGLKGDVSDNIPGVKGIGESGAITLLNQFDTIEGIYAHLDDVPNRYRKVLDGQQEQALFSKRLATIECNVPVQLNLEDCRLAGYNRDAVIALFQELQFGSLVRKLPPSDQPSTSAVAEESGNGATNGRNPANGAPAQMGLFDTDAAGEASPQRPAPAVVPPTLGTYHAVRTPDELAALVQRLEGAPSIAFDAETSGLGFVDAEVVGLSFAVQPGEAWYVPIGHQGADRGPQLDRAAVRDALLPVLEDGGKPKVAHNGKFDVLALRKMDIQVRGLQFDTMIAAILLGNLSVGLKDLAFNVLKLREPMTEITELIGSGKQQITFDYVPIERATPYAAADADMTLRLRDHLDQELDKVPRIRKLFETIEMPLLPVLADMEWHGIKVDVDILQQLAVGMQQRLHEIERQMFEIAGGPFNTGSGQQLNTILFEKLQVPTAGLSKTKTGLYSITAEVLDKLSGVHPIIDLILEHRQLTKLKSTYLDALPQLVDRQSRLHTEFKQLGAATGRLSSNNPNLQNIPVRTEQGREIRRAFVAEQGYYLMSADYSQVELRILAHITQDPALVETFKEGRDIHAATAARLFGVPINQVTKNQRRIAKTTVFGTIYGISSFGLAARTDLSRAEAQQLIDGLFETYPGLKRLFDETLEFGRQHGYVETLFGRRRYFGSGQSNALNSKGPGRAAAEREAKNAPIQGTSADLIKLAMGQLFAELRRRGLQARMLLQVHDELVLEVPDDELDEVQQLVREIMEGVYPELTVPLEVEVSTGRNWEEMR
ncbi:MAG: DNA polymerase I [Chloroflexota bacterium]|nr:DNA polymerase I [Chloroflexota bacterium]